MSNTHHDVAHNWANQTGRARRGHNMFYDGDTIYSYGAHFPIARIVTREDGARCVLFTTDSYSVSTAKHMTITRRALHGLDMPIFRVPFISEAVFSRRSSRWYGASEIHAANIESYHSRVKSAYERSKRRRNKHYAVQDLRTCERLIAECKECARFFDLKETTSFPANIQESIALYEKEAREAEEKRRAEEKKALKTWIEEKLPRWRMGEKLSCPYSSYKYLRVRRMDDNASDYIETSGYARIPVTDAIAAWPELIRLKKICQARDTTVTNQMKLGNFTLDHASKQGIRVGCHFIEWSEIEYIAKELELA